MRSCLISMAVLVAACTPPASTPDAGADAGAVEDAGGGPESCEGTWIGRVRGTVLELDGSPTEAPRVYTICGNACLYREVGDDGTFDDAIDFCFPPGDPLHTPVFIFHGLGRYTDLYLDFVPDGSNREDDTLFEQPFIVAPIESMSSLTIDTTVAQTLADGAGFELTFEPGAIEPPPGRERIAVRRMDRASWSAWPTLGEMTAMYALLPDDTIFHTPASVRFPNDEGLAPDTPVEILGLGNVETGAPYAGNWGRVALGHVLSDGSAIVLDDGEGLEALTWLGYRALE